ncbi:hypothetical protein F5I97DRAFT_640375 [Phlebopus sp. FC_14]|nr:hypothetical protein F5I97DRAFT_640375 [Phlebopus sp. FC_14]
MSDAWSSPSTDYDELPPPSSPLISRLNLPDDDDEMPHIIPSSPCRRSCSDLPDTDVEMSHLSESDDASSVVSSSPSQILLSLPGADTDDELLPVDSMSLTPAAAASFLPCPPGQPLLFIDDPRDVPLLRSPSPEDFHISLSPEDITDPELSQLFELRKRSIAAANAAPADGSDLFTRVEARKTRRRERERCKELSDLLRLKLEGNKVGTTSPKSHEDEQLQPQPQQQRDRQNHRRRGALSSMSQLVAQMVFRRNDTSRPLAKRKTGMIPREYIRSSLSRAASG